MKDGESLLIEVPRGTDWRRIAVKFYPGVPGQSPRYLEAGKDYHILQTWRSPEVRFELGGVYTPPLPPDNPVPPSERPPAAIDPRDLEALRYQIEGLKGELEDSKDILSDIRSVLLTAPGQCLVERAKEVFSDSINGATASSILKLVRDALRAGEGVPTDDAAKGAMDRIRLLERELAHAIRIRDITHKALIESGEYHARLRKILKAKPGIETADTAAVLMDRLSELPQSGETYDVTVRQKIYDLLEGRPGETLTDSTTRVMGRLANAEKLMNYFQKIAETPSPDHQLSSGDIVVIKDLLGGTLEESLYSVAVRAKARIMELERKVAS